MPKDLIQLYGELERSGDQFKAWNRMSTTMIYVQVLIIQYAEALKKQE